MPEFIPEHTPKDLDEFTQGYMEAMEWLLDESVDRDKLRGFTRQAIKSAKADCADFQRFNKLKLEEYENLSGRSKSYAGHDFYLSRNGHGTGFFDRGNEPVFQELQGAAKVYGSTNEWVTGGWIFSE